VFELKLCKTLLFLIIFFTLFIGCNLSTPLPTPTPIEIEKTEIPSYILSTITNVAELKQWLWQNYNYTSDEIWSGYSDYPLTPAEFFMSEILINGVPVSKNTLIGDCEDYAGLAAYLLWKCFDCQSYIAIITLTPYLARAIAYGISPDGNCIVVNAPLVNIQYATINDYLSDYYSGKKISLLFKLENYLNSLYLQGHHQYWDEEI